jgi:hypothetical protein
LLVVVAVVLGRAGATRCGSGAFALGRLGVLGLVTGRLLGLGPEVGRLGALGVMLGRALKLALAGAAVVLPSTGPKRSRRAVTLARTAMRCGPSSSNHRLAS